MSMHLKFLAISIVLFVVTSVSASIGRPRCNENDRSVYGPGIAEDGSPMPMESDSYPVEDVERGVVQNPYGGDSGDKSHKDRIEAVQADDTNLKSEQESPKSNVPWTWIFLSLVVGGVAGFVLGRVGRQSPAPNIVAPSCSDNGLPKCPRCGMEHNPGDTVCKNPKCKTQF